MSDALVISLIPGYTFTVGEIVTEDKLNLMGRPTVNFAGTIGTAILQDNSVTVNILADNALAATTAGRAKMQDGYFDASSVSRAKFSPGFFGAGDATSLALFDDGFWTDDAAGRAKFAPGFFGAIAPAVGSSRNLLILNNVITPNSKVDISADEVVLKNSDNDPFVATGVVVAANMATSGANGLDTGSEAASTWYYVYLIYNGTTVASLLSTSNGAPTLPSGYTYSALVGVVRNDGSSNFLAFYQQDREIFINEAVVFTGKTGATSWTAISGADLTAFQGLVPPIAKMAWGNAGASGNDGGIALGADANALGACLAVHGQHISGTTLTFGLGGNWRAPLKTPQTIYYIMANTSNGYRVTVSGFKI